MAECLQETRFDGIFVSVEQRNKASGYLKNKNQTQLLVSASDVVFQFFDVCFDRKTQKFQIARSHGSWHT